MTRRTVHFLIALLVSLFVAAPATFVSAESAVPSQRVCTHPSVGFPTCYSLQTSGLWAREELPDRETGWIVVGMVTVAEVEELTAATP